MSLFLGTARLCKCSVRQRARLSRLLTGRRVHNMSPTQPDRQPVETLTENRKRVRERGKGYKGILSQNPEHYYLSSSSPFLHLV